MKRYIRKKIIKIIKIIYIVGLRTPPVIILKIMLKKYFLR